EITRGQSDHRVVPVEARDHDLADLARWQRIASTRLDDFDDNAFLDNHPVESGTLVSNHTNVCRGVGLKYGEAALLVFLPQRRKKGASGYDRFLKKIGRAHV